MQQETTGRFNYAPALAAEFGKAARLAGHIKSAFARWSVNIGGSHLTARLVTPLVKLIRSDTRHAVGKRSAAWGDTRHLEGFEFNEWYRPRMTGISCRLLRSAQSDQVLVKTDAFAADAFLTSQVREATHFKAGLLVAAIPLCLHNHTQVFRDFADSALVGTTSVPSMQVLADLFIAETPVLYCIALSVAFFRFAGSLSVPYKQGSKDLLRIIKVFCA